MNPSSQAIDDMTWVVEIDVLTKRLELGTSTISLDFYASTQCFLDPSNADDWHQMGRTYMVGQNYSKAYEALQEAVYRNGRHPMIWCDVGRLYLNINQFRDALDAYSRAIRINPYIAQVWILLGQLYEDANKQYVDSFDAFQRALELDPTNKIAKRKVRELGVILQVQKTQLEPHFPTYAYGNVNIVDEDDSNYGERSHIDDDYDEDKFEDEEDGSSSRNW